MTNLNGPDAYGTNDPLARTDYDPTVTGSGYDAARTQSSEAVLNSGDPDAIREEIERTRADLGSDVDALAEKVNPAKIVQRRTDKVKGALGSVKDKVMGVASDAKDNTGGMASDVGSSVGGAASSAAHAVKAAPGRAVETAKGNPLAVGLIAFGVGWLAASLIPASSKERELASQAKEAAQPLAQQATEVAKEAAENLKEPAKEAAEAVKGTATEAVDAVKSEGQSAAEDVKGRTQEAKDNVQNS